MTRVLSYAISLCFLLCLSPTSAQTLTSECPRTLAQLLYKGADVVVPRAKNAADASARLATGDSFELIENASGLNPSSVRTIARSLFGRSLNPFSRETRRKTGQLYFQKNPDGSFAEFTGHYIPRTMMSPNSGRKLPEELRELILKLEKEAQSRAPEGSLLELDDVELVWSEAKHLGFSPASYHTDGPPLRVAITLDGPGTWIHGADGRVFQASTGEAIIFTGKETTTDRIATLHSSPPGNQAKADARFFLVLTMRHKNRSPYE